MFEKILVVCVGNICRSPTGERLLQQHLPNKHIESAGIGTEKSGLTGKAADKTANELALLHGIDLSGHQAKQLTPTLCQNYDLILVMEKGHIEAVCKIAPEARGKTMLFGHWMNQTDIPDPYMKSREAFEHAYTLLEKSTLAWMKKIK
ncbi:phosphotyrosine protein phosphatase [Vibrio litoralis]|uniref:arsenate reductase/protein-tyrosine-phosphatase family protein n=1 Tax=Vibrio litoralis TaxID=335972 RepID=UPI0003FDFCDF|nr:phosphotyrosine protein phosphatase [Vibrio litoralis]